ncbi:MAG: hypothetical protein M1814_006423 [Vezdaea aestivalis]|nr:MAG: hypothetical protein M1814_006423 [Vezdaea aestivalis]
MPSSDVDHNYYSLPRHGQSQPGPDGQDDDQDHTRWLPDSSSPPQSAPISAHTPPRSNNYAVSHTPYSSPQRPTVATNFQTFVANSKLNGSNPRREDDSPDPHDFYRQFQDPFTSSPPPALSDDNQDMTQHSYQRKTAASAARAQPPTSRYSALNSTRNGAAKSSYRSSSLSSETSNASISNFPASRMKKPSLKDLVHRFEQAGDESMLQPSRPPYSRNVSSSTNNTVTFLRSRTPSNQAMAMRDSDKQIKKTPRPAQLRRPSEGEGSFVRSSNHLGMQTERSKSAAPGDHLPSPRQEKTLSSSGRMPLFGEVLTVTSLNDPGFGIPAHHRRSSDGSLYPPSPAMRNMEYSPSSPTAWYLGAAPTSASHERPKSRGHRRAHSEFVGEPPNNTSGSLDRTAATLSPHASSISTSSTATPKRISQSKIPLSTRIRSPSESGPSPPSTRSNSSLGKPLAGEVIVPRGHSGIPKPNRRSATPEQTRPLTPTRPRRRDKSPSIQGEKSPRLKAYISAPMPKKSPPLRSSRPRQPISNAASAAPRTRVVDRFSNYSHDTASSRDTSRTRDVKPKPKRLPELGGVDFAARREKIQRAFTKSVRESEKKEEIQRRRLTRPTDERERAQKDRQVEQGLVDGPDQTEASNHDRHTELGYIPMQVSGPTSPLDDTASPPSTLDADPSSPALDGAKDGPIELTLDTFLPSSTYRRDESSHNRSFQAPDSPTLGMPGSFPQSDEHFFNDAPIPSINLEPDSAVSENAPPFTPIDNEPQVDQPEFKAAPTRNSPNLLSQIMKMREQVDDGPSQHAMDRSPEIDDAETIDIMLGGTPLQGNRRTRDAFPWEAETESPTDPTMGSHWPVENSKPASRSRNLQTHISMDRISEKSRSPDRREEDWGHVDLANANLGTDTMNSEAYSTINRVLDQYHVPPPVNQSDFQSKILGHSPELARQGGWDPTKMTQLYLQELAKGKVNKKHYPQLSPVDTSTTRQLDNCFDAATPVTEIDHEDALVPDRLRGYQLSDGGWSSQRESIATEDSQLAHGRQDTIVGATLNRASDWIDASPSFPADWADAETPPAPKYHPPEPPPKDPESLSPLRRSSSALRDDTATPKLNGDRPILPEIKSTGEGLGLQLGLDDDSTAFQPLTDQVSIPESESAQIASAKQKIPPVPHSPSVYRSNPPSSVFPRLFPDGRGQAPTSVRLGEDDSPASYSPGTPVLTSNTPPTSETRSQERPSADLSSRKSTDLQREETGPSPEQKRLSQRRFVIKELVDTEKSFLQDMTVTDEIYKGTASPPLNPEDVKTLFGNSDQIVAFSKVFLESLKQASNSVYVLPTSSSSKRGSTSTAASVDRSSVVMGTLTDDEKDRKTFIGEAFGQHMARMEKVYSEYLRNHDAANKRLVKIQNIPNVVIWLGTCRSCADDLTTAWSLDSLLVKPVQRILKYPLLLGQLLEVTPENHPDFTALDVAVREMTGASHRINEMKKRVDAIEKVVGRKRKESDVRTGLSKAFGRRTEKFRQQVGLSDIYEDREYAEIAQKFGSHFMHLHLVMKDVESYTTDIQTAVDKFLSYVTAMDSLVLLAQSGYPELESRWRKFGQAMREMSSVALSDHKASVRRGVIDPMVTLLGMHDGPQKIMAKRNKRLIDYGRLRAMKERGDKPDKRTIEQGDQFQTLNDTLKDELPKLFALTTKLVEACLDKFVGCQMAWHSLWRTKLEQCLDRHSIPKGTMDILDAFNADFPLTCVQVESLGICNGALLADAVSLISASQNLLNDDSTSNLAIMNSNGRSGSASSSSSRPQPPFNRHRTASMNSDKSPSLPTPDFGKRHSGSGFGFGATDSYPATRVRSSSNSQPRALPPTSDPSRIYPNPSRPSTSSRGQTFDSPNAAPWLMGTAARPPTPSSRPFSNVFTSALPLSNSPSQDGSPVERSRSPSRLDGAGIIAPSVTPGASIPAPPALLHSSSSGPPARRPPAPTQGQEQFNVLFLAASLFEFNIDRARKEAGYPYLTYVPGEIFDVIGEKGELWLAKNQDDPGCLVGWIWCKHFAKLEGLGGGGYS